MLLLGVVQAQASGGVAGAGSYDLLATEILTGSQASVTFSSLGDYAATYQHLQIRWTMRNAETSGGQSALWVQYNADTGANYSWHRLYGNGIGAGSDSLSSQTKLLASVGTRNSATSGNFAGGVIDILDPFESSKNTTLRCLGGESAFIQLGSGAWFNTNSLTEVKIFSDANMNTGSRFSLYGWKAA